MPKSKLTPQDRDALVKAKIWWDSGACIQSLVIAIEKANFYMSRDIRSVARRKIMNNRDDGNPFKSDKIAKTTGHYTRESRARPYGKAPKFRKSNGINQIMTAQHSVTQPVHVYGTNRMPMTVRPKSSIVGPIRGGKVTGIMISGMTVARKTEFGGSQTRFWRTVPAVKQRGKRNTKWDGDYRWEFARDVTKVQETQKTRQMWYIHLSRQGIIPKQKSTPNRIAEYYIPYQTGAFTQKDRPYMRLGLQYAITKRFKYLKEAKKEFPLQMQRWIKIGKAGYKV
jgi:hypothetical protein